MCARVLKRSLLSLAAAQVLQVIASAVNANGGEGVDVVVAALELHGGVGAVYACDFDGLHGVHVKSVTV